MSDGITDKWKECEMEEHHKCRAQPGDPRPKKYLRRRRRIALRKAIGALEECIRVYTEELGKDMDSYEVSEFRAKIDRLNREYHSLKD